MDGGLRANRVGYRVYLDIVRMIASGPHDAHQIEAATGWSRRPILRFLRVLERMELAHVESWVKPEGSRCRVERFVLGPGVSSPQPQVRGGKFGRKHMQTKAFLHQGLAIGNLLRALSEGATCTELVQKSGICRRTMGKLIPFLIEQPRIAHIGGWRRRAAWGGPPEPIYVLGNRRHADRPKPQEIGQANRKYRAKVAVREGRSIGYSAFSPMAQAAL